MSYLSAAVVLGAIGAWRQYRGAPALVVSTTYEFAAMFLGAWMGSLALDWLSAHVSLVLR